MTAVTLAIPAGGHISLGYSVPLFLRSRDGALLTQAASIAPFADKSRQPYEIRAAFPENSRVTPECASPGDGVINVLLVRIVPLFLVGGSTG